MDISRHKGPAYESEGSNAEAINELNTSRHNMDNSGSKMGMSFRKSKPVEKSDADKPAAEPKAEDQPTGAGADEDMA